MKTRDRTLYYFMLVAEELNISSVARSLYMSQQALSKHIQRLEEELGVPLFKRGKRLELTGEGQRVLMYAKRVLDMEADLRASIQSNVVGPSRFAVGLATDCGDMLIAPLVRRLRRLWPGTATAFVPFGYMDAPHLLKQNIIQAYFGMLHAVGKYGKQIPLFDDQLYFLLPSDLFRQLPRSQQNALMTGTATGVLLRDIVQGGMPLITPWKASHMGSALYEKLARVADSLNVVSEVVTFSEIFSLSTNGFGGAFAFKSQIYANLGLCERENLYFFPIRDMAETFTLGLICNEGEEETPIMREFIRCTKEAAEEVSRESDAGLEEYCRNEFKQA